MTADQRRDAIERALIHHGIDYSPPERMGGVTLWRVHAHSGTKRLTHREIEAFCEGLSTREANERAAWDPERMEEVLVRLSEYHGYYDALDPTFSTHADAVQALLRDLDHVTSRYTKA
jgi:hypothetical protein